MLLKDSEWLPRLAAAEYSSFAEQPSLAARLTGHAAALLAGMVGALAERRERRKTYRKLAELDDHMLADVGISRSDLPGWTSRGIGGWAGFDPKRAEPRRQ